MKRKAKIFTPSDVIAWLKRQRKTATFHWFNNEGDLCLFSRFVQSKLKTNQFIGMGGRLSKRDGSDAYEAEPAIPFHDLFWKKTKGKYTVSRNFAIAVLQNIVENPDAID